MKIDKDKIKQMIEITDDIRGDLYLIGSVMPKGYLKYIGLKIQYKYSNGYISQFFSGRFPISEDNECILDAALELLNEEAARWEQIKKRILETLK